jgi:hypothetical protein
MIDSRADVSGRSEEDAGPRPRPRDDGSVRRRLKFRYDTSSSGMSLSSISEPASSTSASEWDDEERRLDSSSTKVLSSRTVSASNVWPMSELALELVPVLVLLVLVVGDGKGVLVPNGCWWCWWRRMEAACVLLFPNKVAGLSWKRWASWARRGGAGTRIAWQLRREV